MPSPWDRQLNQIRGASFLRVGLRTKLVTIDNGESGSKRRTWERTNIGAAGLWAQAGLTADVYAVARCVGSEESATAPAEAFLAIAEACRNEARVWKGGARGFDAMIRQRRIASFAFTRGWYGIQRGGWAATSRDPRTQTVAAAKAVLGNKTNFSGGARRWVSPKAMDHGYQAGKKLGKTASDLIKQWGGEGWQWIGPLPNIDPYKLMLFVKLGNTNNVNTTGALFVVGQGRAGKSIAMAKDATPVFALVGAAAAAGVAWKAGLI